MTLRNVTIDDRDNTTIKYQGGWVKSNFGNLTITASSNPGDNFTVVTPPILAFYYFGFYTSHKFQICIDCDPNNQTWVIIYTSDPTNDYPALIRLGVIYSKRWEDAVVHEIIVANPAVQEKGAEPFLYLDRLVYTVDNGSDPSMTLSFSTSSQTHTSSFSTNSQSSTSPIIPQEKSTLSKTAIGAIAGGGICGILFIFAIAFLCRRKKRRTQRVKEENPINPFMMDTSTLSRPVNKDSLATELQQPGPVSSETGLIDDGYGSVVTLVTRARVVRREEDGGSIHGFSELGGESTGTLPPDYNDLIERRRT